MKNQIPGLPSGQVFIEVVLWIPLVVGIFIGGSALFKREYKQFKIDYEHQRYHLNGGNE